MGRAQQDETLWDAGKEGNVALRGFLTCAPHQTTGVIKAQDGLGEKAKKLGRAQQDGTLWDADEEGRVTLLGSLACAPPPGLRCYN